MGWGSGMNAPQPAERRAGWAFRLSFALLAAGIVTVGFLYYRNYEQNYRAEAERLLSGIAELKVGELLRYRQERFGDATILLKNPAFPKLVRRFLEQPADAEVQPQLQAWLRTYEEEANYQYDQVFLLDTQGIARLSSPTVTMPVAALISARVPEVLRSGQVAFQDFYRHEQNQRVYLSLLIPLHDEADGNRPLGVLVLRIDPAAYLYPFIQRWPVPSKTAETLLVRREVNEVLFLNELRFQTNTALRLRAPLDRVSLPAAQAALGRNGLMQGRDYRGVPAVAALRAIPDSPWSLVAKMDTVEVQAPLRERLWLTLFLIGALLLGTGAAAGVLWRRQRLRFYQEKASVLEAQRASEVRYRRLFESAKDGILILDAETGVVVDVNPFLTELLGFSHADFLGKKVWDLGFFKDLIANQDNFAELQQKEYLRYEDMALETRAGRRIQVEFISNAYLVNRQKVIQCAIRDISERKAAEAQLQRTLADLERSNKELEQFAYVASHDLQEPLRMVSSYTQLLGQRYDSQLDDKARKYIHYAVDGAIRMQALINDLLAYSRVATRGKPLQPSDSHAVLGEAIRNLAALIEENQAIITNNDLPTVRADAAQLVLVFQNLLANAIKFRSSGLPSVHVSAQNRGPDWIFSVQDNGIGIEPQHAERVFVIFQRLHTRQEYPGTGIGLAVCKRVVERHGGRIWFESEPGKGTTFFFTLPK